MLKLNQFFLAVKWIFKYNAKCAEMKYWKLRYHLLKEYGK